MQGFLVLQEYVKVQTEPLKKTRLKFPITLPFAKASVLPKIVQKVLYSRSVDESRHDKSYPHILQKSNRFEFLRQKGLQARLICDERRRF